MKLILKLLIDSLTYHEFNKDINEKNIKIKNILFKKDDSIELKSDTNRINSTSNHDLYSKEMNGEDKVISFNSYAYNPKISVNNIKINFQNCSNININDKNNDCDDNNFKESYKFNYKEKDNDEYYFKSYNNTFTHLPISEYNYFTKDNKLIIKNNNYEIKMKRKKYKLKATKINKSNILTNNVIPIKSAKENDGKNIPFIISKDMDEKFNKKTESNKIKEITRNVVKKNIKESYSIDSKILSKNKNVNIFKNNFTLNIEENNSDKKRKYKIRSVVKFIKKNKFNLNNIELFKEEELKIKEEIKKNSYETKEEQIHNDKIIKILKEEIENFISYFNKRNIEKGDNHNYNWSIIEQLIIKVKVDLIDIINCFLKICNDIIDNKTKMKICIEYIKLLIVFYTKNYLKENNVKTIHIKILKILYNIEKISINNKYKYEILGNIFYLFLIERLFNENDLNYFDKENEQLVIDLAKLVKFIIFLFSKDKNIAKEKYSKFESLQLFNNNHIYFNYVTKYLKSLLNI